MSITTLVKKKDMKQLPATKYRVIEVNEFWKYHVQRLQWYWPFWIKVHGTDNKQDAIGYVDNRSTHRDGNKVVYERTCGAAAQQANASDIIFE